MVGAGFGPSSGRFVQVCESSEARRKPGASFRYPVVGVLSFFAVVFGLIYSYVLLYEEEAVLGALVLVAVAGLAVLLAVYAFRASRSSS